VLCLRFVLRFHVIQRPSRCLRPVVITRPRCPQHLLVVVSTNDTLSHSDVYPFIDAALQKHTNVSKIFSAKQVTKKLEYSHQRTTGSNPPPFATTIAITTLTTVTMAREIMTKEAASVAASTPSSASSQVSSRVGMQA
jgi:hypothetical protein